MQLERNQPESRCPLVSVHLSIVRVRDVVARLAPEPKGALAAACFPHARTVM